MFSPSQSVVPVFTTLNISFLHRCNNLGASLSEDGDAVPPPGMGVHRLRHACHMSGAAAGHGVLDTPQGRSAKLTVEAPMPGGGTLGKSQPMGYGNEGRRKRSRYARKNFAAGRRTLRERGNRRGALVVDWRTTSDDVTLRKTFSPRPVGIRVTAVDALLEHFHRQTATASSPGAIDVSAGDRLL